MKPVNIYILTSLFLFQISCIPEKTSEQFSRIVFDPAGLKVITSSVNRQLGTMSILYGNSQSYQQALTESTGHTAGEEYSFVTWKYEGNPLYDGSDINGELLCVEHITTQRSQAGKVTITYELKQGKPMPVKGKSLNKLERIHYIIEHRPAILP